MIVLPFVPPVNSKSLLLTIDAVTSSAFVVNFALAPSIVKVSWVIVPLFTTLPLIKVSPVPVIVLPFVPPVNSKSLLLTISAVTLSAFVVNFALAPSIVKVSWVIVPLFTTLPLIKVSPEPVIVLPFVPPVNSKSLLLTISAVTLSAFVVNFACYITGICNFDNTLTY